MGSAAGSYSEVVRHSHFISSQNRLTPETYHSAKANKYIEAYHTVNKKPR